MIQSLLAAGLLALSFGTTTPAALTIGAGVAVAAMAFTSAGAQAQPAADRRYQPGSGSCRDSAGRRC